MPAHGASTSSSRTCRSGSLRLPRRCGVAAPTRRSEGWRRSRSRPRRRRLRRVPSSSAFPALPALPLVAAALTAGPGRGVLLGFLAGCPASAPAWTPACGSCLDSLLGLSGAAPAVAVLPGASRLRFAVPVGAAASWLRLPPPCCRVVLRRPAGRPADRPAAGPACGRELSVLALVGAPVVLRGAAPGSARTRFPPRRRLAGLGRALCARPCYRLWATLDRLDQLTLAHPGGLDAEPAGELLELGEQHGVQAALAGAAAGAPAVEAVSVVSVMRGPSPLVAVRRSRRLCCRRWCRFPAGGLRTQACRVPGGDAARCVAVVGFGCLR